MTDFNCSPVRELDSRIIEFFTRANKEIVKFHESINDSINHSIELCGDMFITAKVDLVTNTICLSMPFLDAFWCSFFAMHALDEEIKKFSKANPNEKFFNIQSVDVGKHYTFVLNQYNKILNNNTELEWDSSFVNPKNLSFSNELNSYIEETNQLYIIGISAIMLHECCHVFYKHNQANIGKDEIRIQEREADKKANALLLENFDDANKEYTIAYAILLDYLTMLFMCKHNAKIKDATHPVIHDRIRFLFEDFIENSCIEESSKIALYHLCLQVFDMFLSQRQAKLESYENITDVRKAFYDNLDIMDEFITN